MNIMNFLGLMGSARNVSFKKNAKKKEVTPTTAAAVATAVWAEHYTVNTPKSNNS